LPPQLFLLLVVIFLFPVAVYCWVLGMVNRREQPLLVAGPWDCAGLLFASSGFLLVIVPAMLIGLYGLALRELPLAGTAQAGAGALWELLEHWWRLWLGYYAVLVGGVALLLWWRRRKTVVYNVDPAALEAALGQALQRTGLPWTRQGRGYYVGFAAEPVPEPALAAGAAPTAVAPGPPPPAALPRPAGPGARTAVFDVDPFRPMYHVTLHWRQGEDTLRQEVEDGLTAALATVHTEDNPAGAWLLWAALGLFALMFLGVLVLIIRTLLPR
jgi:hypothetical protein